jgi:hypothetical protein
MAVDGDGEEEEDGEKIGVAKEEEHEEDVTGFHDFIERTNGQSGFRVE